MNVFEYGIGKTNSIGFRDQSRLPYLTKTLLTNLAQEKVMLVSLEVNFQHFVLTILGLNAQKVNFVISLYFCIDEVLSRGGS